MCQLPTEAKMPAARGKLENVSYANVMARLDEKMSLSQQMEIMMKEFNYSQSGASAYLKRNNIKNSGRQYKISLYDVEKYVWADMKRSEKIKTIMYKLNVSYYPAWYFVKRHPDCGRKAQGEAKPIEQVIEEKPEVVEPVIEEKLEAEQVDNLAEIKKTISDIESLEAQLKEKKEWLKMLMEDYVKC